MKFLFFDYDRSTASIGGAEGVEKATGLPPMTMDGGVIAFKNRMAEIISVEHQMTDHPVFDKGSTEKVMVPSDQMKEHNVGGIIIDSITRLAEYELDQTRKRMNAQRREEGKDEVDNLTRSWWGNYGDMMTRLFKFLSKLPLTVIATAHETTDKDEVGKRIRLVSMKGSAADSIQEYFDVVGHLGTDGEGHDKTRHIRVADSVTYPQAKDRKKLLKEKIPFVKDGTLDQEALARIISVYRDEGVTRPNILLIGPSGSGKTLLTGTVHSLTQDDS